MGDTFIISGLREKRSAVAGQIVELRLKLDKLQADLFHIRTIVLGKYLPVYMISPNGAQVDRIVTLAMANKPSVDFSGYWQRRRAA